MFDFKLVLDRNLYLFLHMHDYIGRKDVCNFYTIDGLCMGVILFSKTRSENYQKSPIISLLN